MSGPDRISTAYDRGDSDAHYFRPPDPHIRIGNPGLPYTYISEADMTPEEIAAYWSGFDENPTGKKDWR